MFMALLTPSPKASFHIKMVKKRGKAKKSVKRVIKKYICNCCRQSSDKNKDSKVKKLIALAKKNQKPEKKKGFFSRLFGR